MYSRRTCFLPCSGFDEMFEVVFETGTSPAKRAEQERKRLQSIYTPMLRILSCVSQASKAMRKRELSLEVQM